LFSGVGGLSSRLLQQLFKLQPTARTRSLVLHTGRDRRLHGVARREIERDIATFASNTTDDLYLSKSLASQFSYSVIFLIMSNATNRKLKFCLSVSIAEMQHLTSLRDECNKLQQINLFSQTTSVNTCN
jgi:hypothetical protein